MVVAKLNVDVLAIICDLLTEVSHILSFALTCSVFHTVAIRRLLSMGPIFLETRASIRRFHSFMSADKPARARHIRALKIGTPLNPDPRVTEILEAIAVQEDPRLIDILNWCPHLESISVVLRKTYREDTDATPISDVIAGIQSLRSLYIDGDLPDPIAFFQSISAPLRMLRIRRSNIDWSAASLEKILLRFAQTLEQLELGSFLSYPYQTGATISTPPPSIFTLSQCPNVRSFSVAHLDGMPSLAHLQHLFPALADRLSLCLSRVWLEEGSFAAVRAVNQRAQDSDSNNEPSSRPWSKLACVTCSVHMFYVLGLRCPIGLLMLDRVTKYTKRYLVEALREQPVPRLELSLLLGYGLEVFEGLFPQELGVGLTHLTLFCEGDYYERVGSVVEAAAEARRRWDEIVNEMHLSLEPLHGLTHLRVVFHCVHHSRGPLSEAVHEDPYLCTGRGPIFVRAEETAASLARTLPSLEYTFLTVIGRLQNRAGKPQRFERWHHEQAWHVTRETKDGGPVLVELQDEVAQAIIMKEELVLSEADEAALLQRGG